VTAKNNKADTYGGAFYMGYQSVAVIGGTSTFSGNWAQSDGGAIYIDAPTSSDQNATLVLGDVEFSGNTAGSDNLHGLGGAIYAFKADIDIYGTA